LVGAPVDLRKMKMRLGGLKLSYIHVILYHECAAVYLFVDE